MNQLIDVSKKEDIFPEYSNTPIGLLLEYQNLDRPLDEWSSAQLLTGMCMDNRKHLRIPENFSYIIRTGGANLRHSEFKISYAIAVGGVKHIALIGHDNCGMVNLFSRKEQFIQGLVNNAGWDYKKATNHFTMFAPMFELENEIDFVVNESKRIRLRYPKVIVAPMFYKLDENRIYLIK
ncbi:MAG: carbonic anhydrase [Saprospiraceae bacterium]|nr:carbonic anhydrase [Saprospiraceae bacterium]